MRYADINKKFTEIVTDYMGKGYIINTASMSGSQGEVAKVDLTDGKEIIRIRVASFSNWEDDTRGYEIVIGKSTDNVKPNTNDTWGTIWDGNLEVIETIRFYAVDRRSNVDFYVTEEEAKTAVEVRNARYMARFIYRKTEDVTDKAKEIAKKVIRREFGVKRISEADIKVTKRDGKYTVSYKNKSYRLH